MPLGAGSIAFTGFNADGNDNLSFVMLQDIAAGTVINFTDAAWNGTAFVANENQWTWTATGDIAAGTVVTMDDLATQSPTSNAGTIAYSTTAVRDLSVSSESIFAYVGASSAPTFLTAISNNGFATAVTGRLDNTGLILGATAIDLGIVDAQADIAVYNGSRTALSTSDLLASINNPANWITQDASGNNAADGIGPDAPLPTAPFLVDPTAQKIGFASDSVTVSRVEGDVGTTTIYTFTVERTSGTTGTVTFSGTVTPGTNTDAADFPGGTLPLTFSGTIADGAATGTVSIMVSGDFTKEADESFQLTLKSASNTQQAVVVTGQTQATGTIVNDDTQDSTPLEAGSIAFTGFNAHGDDNLSFVVLEDIAAGTVINFTDKAWNGTTFNSPFSSAENHWSWTATSSIAAGTVVTLDDLATASPTSNAGSIAYLTTAPHDVELGSEAIYAYIGSVSSPTFLAAFSTAGFDSPNVTGVLTNTGLVNGVTAVDLMLNHNIAAYVGPRAAGAASDLLAAINNRANWISQQTVGDGAHDGTAPDTPFSTAPFVIDPTIQLLGFASNSVTVSQVEGDNGTATLYTFTVERANGTAGDVTFSGTLTPGAGVNAADFGGTLPLTFSGTIAAGETTGTVTIAVSGDITLEADETFRLALTSASNTEKGVFITGQTRATGTIVNNDTQFQTIAWSTTEDVVQSEGDAGTSVTYTFTVVRNSTEGNLTFTAAVYPQGSAGANADDFGGALPTTLTGTILDGQTTGTISITVTGDDLLENIEGFQVQLTGGVTDAGIAAVAASGSSVSGVILNDDFVVHDGESITALVTLTGDDHLVVEHGGSLGGSLSISGANIDVVIDNHGVYGSSAMFPTAASGSLTVNNFADGEMLGPLFQFGVSQIEDVVINNDGRIDAGAAGILASGAVINNSSTGIITAAALNGVDGVRAAVVNNYGQITGGEDSVIAGTVHNYAGGLIQGPRHAVTGSSGITVINEAGGRMIGTSGSAVNIDNTSSEASRVFVTNYGVMEGGRPLAGDGDAVDVDGLLTLENHGRVAGLGAYGYHDGEPNVSEGIAIGGGTINNYAGAEIYGYGRAIQIDNSGNDAAFASAMINNAGLIQGDGHPPEGVTPAELALFTGRIKSGEAINIKGTFADTITNSGTIIGGVKTDGGDDVLTNSGTMTATGGSAIDMGDGDDTVTLQASSAVTGAILLGAGNDVLTAVDGTIDVDGGDGDDEITAGRGNDTLAGGLGEDRLDGGLGGDALYGGVGDDLMEGGADDDHIDGGDDDDVIFGDGGHDTITGGLGNDTVKGGAGDDIFVVDSAADGRDSYDAGTGIDTLDYSALGTAVTLTLRDGAASTFSTDTIENVENVIGGSAEDKLTGNALDNALTGNAGDDTLKGMDGNDALDGGDGADTLDGGVGNDQLAGGLNDDVLKGAAGNDSLFGGAGDDILTGGAGNDVFVFKAVGDGVDTITDFRTSGASADHIALSASMFQNFTGDDAFDLIGSGFLRAQPGSGTTQIQVDVDGGGDQFVTLATVTGSISNGVLADYLLIA